MELINTDTVKLDLELNISSYNITRYIGSSDLLPSIKILGKCELTYSDTDLGVNDLHIICRSGSIYSDGLTAKDSNILCLIDNTIGNSIDMNVITKPKLITTSKFVKKEFYKYYERNIKGRHMTATLNVPYSLISKDKLDFIINNYFSYYLNESPFIHPTPFDDGVIIEFFEGRYRLVNVVRLDKINSVEIIISNSHENEELNIASSPMFNIFQMNKLNILNSIIELFE